MCNLNYMKISRSEFSFTFLLLPIFLFTGCLKISSTSNNDASLEKNFMFPPNEARPNVMWWWLNSYVTEEGITRDLEEMKKQGIGGALIFDAAPVDRWKPKDVAPAPVGPPFMSERWRQLFRHAIKEADRLDIELGVSITSGFNAGGPWVTPEYGQQEIVWSEMTVDSLTPSPILLPLPAGPVYGEQGELLKYNEMEVNNDLELTPDGTPVHFRDIAVLAIPIKKALPHSAGKIPDLKSATGRVKNWALKSVHSFNYPEDRGFVFNTVYEDTVDVQDELTISRNSVVDLSGSLDDRGMLHWEIPKGRWMILRFGHTHTGIRLQATNPHNEGLAMNHLSREAATRHFDEIARKMLVDKQAVNGKNPAYFYLDSWEVRIANWTPGFRQIFKERRGYDMTPFLPVLAGMIVDNRDISNRFLHDYRMTIGDCIADNYYGTFSALSHENGMQYRAEMATTPIPVDMLKCLGRVDVPFGEFWTETDLPEGRRDPWERMFGKQAASAAHIYGLPYAAAEALTVIQKHWEHSPFQLKKTIDQALCSGLNRLMIHTFTHSPPETKAPGYEYFAGTHFNPQITWWDQARAFTDYISRCQYLLQQGHFVADVCFYQGDQIPAFVPMKQSQPGLGAGYDYDMINTETIMNRLTFENGWLMLPDGMRYRLLILPDTDMIDPSVLAKVAELVEKGATVLGRRPQRAYGLENFPNNDSLVSGLAGKVWGNCDGVEAHEGAYGTGRIICGKTAREVLLDDKILPDFEYTGAEEHSTIDYIHRRIGEAIDIYFVINSGEHWKDTECTFRVADRKPELWDPATGEIKAQEIFQRSGERVTMTLRFAPHGSAFVVFRKPLPTITVKKVQKNKDLLSLSGGEQERGLPVIDRLTLSDNHLSAEIWQSGDFEIELSDGRMIATGHIQIPDPMIIDGPWKVRFPEGLGAPDSIMIDQLISWTESEIEGVRYFSGTAVYQTEFVIDQELTDQNLRYYLDLGSVKDVAAITLNGQNIPVLWKVPYRADITPWLTAGQNRLSIEITNLWPNRLIGDQFLPRSERIGFTNIAKFTRESPLLESGLIGPVKILAASMRVLTL